MKNIADFFKWFFAICISQPIIPALVIAAIAVYFIFGGVESCRNSSWNKKVEQTKENIQNSAVNAAISEATANATEKQVNKLENIANEKGNISNQAGSNFNATLNRSSGSFSSNAADAKRNYCADNFADPLCRDR